MNDEDAMLYSIFFTVLIIGIIFLNKGMSIGSIILNIEGLLILTESLIGSYLVYNRRNEIVL